MSMVRKQRAPRKFLTGVALAALIYGATINAAAAAGVGVSAGVGGATAGVGAGTSGTGVGVGATAGAPQAA